MSKRVALQVLGAAWLLSSCAVGPDFERPKNSASSVYDSSEATAQTPPAIVTTPGATPPASSTIALDMNAEVPAQWWQL